MIKFFHLGFVLLSVISFISRIILSETHSKLLKQKVFKIIPHLIDTLLLSSGVLLIYQGHWLSGDYGWIIAKMAALCGYIGTGVIAMRKRGIVRWLAFFAAMLFFLYIGMVAVSKNSVFFVVW